MPDWIDNKVYTTRQVLFALFVLLGCCLISYWPLSTGIFSLKNDATRYFLPVRYQISEMIRHGYFPFWTPYINLGHPLYTDMQSGVWNPFVWLISFMGSYTMRSLQAEVLVYVYLSGVSMYFLLKYFRLSPAVALSLSVCYMLCGFISDSAQFLYWICGSAFLPLIFLFFHKMLNELSLRTVMPFSFFLYLLFVTAYPGQSIIIFYFLLAYFIYYFLQKRRWLVKGLALVLLSGCIFLLLSLPAILAYKSGLEFITRGGGIKYSDAMTNSLHPLYLISFLFPLATSKLPFFDTDILGRNIFFGLLPLILCLTAFFVKRKNIEATFLKWVFVLSIILSLGKYGLLRPLSYYVLPYMNTFRHPSLFRFLSIFSACILAAFVLERYTNQSKDPFTKKTSFRIVCGLMLISSVIVLLVDPTVFSFSLPTSFTTSAIKQWMESSGAVHWLVTELVIQLLFMILIYRFFVKKVSLKAIAFLCIANSLVHTMLLQPITVVSSEKVLAFESRIAAIRREGFPAPDLHANLITNSQPEQGDSLSYTPVNMFNKKLGLQDAFVIPGPLKLYEKLMNNQEAKKAVLTHAVFYRIDTDTGFTSRILNFSPNRWEIEVNSATAGFYCLSQTYHPKWRLLINDKNETLHLCNTSMMGFRLSAGKNVIILEFEDNTVRIAFYIQVALLALVLTYFVWSYFRRR